MIRYLVPLLALGIIIVGDGAVAQGKGVRLRGINIAGGEFAGEKLPGVYGRDYIFPSPDEIGHFAKAGMNTIRVPFLWERLQPALNGPFNADELARLDGVVANAERENVMIVLDSHNYAKYRGKDIGSADVPVAAFVDFWKRLAKHYLKSPSVIFGLMNEPYRPPSDQWAQIAQAATIGIRQTGAKQLILVPGTIWSGAHSWLKKVGQQSNAEALAGFRDPGNNFAYEMHQYFDSDSSGTTPNCVSEDVGIKALTNATEWLRKQGRQGFLGEFGASKDPTCLAALRATLKYMQDNSDVWMGWTYWSAGAWFGNYMFYPYPLDRTPQGMVLKDFSRAGTSR